MFTQAMAECSGNLVSDNLMSSPVAETAFKTTALKVIMVCLSTCLDEFPQPQAILMFICPCLSAYLQIRSVSASEGGVVVGGSYKGCCARSLRLQGWLEARSCQQT